jgi:hypothetical protein
MANDDLAIAVIEEQADTSIRRMEVDGVWYFSVIDVIAVLTDSANPRNYWNMLKSRMSEEGAQETYTKCVQLKMKATDGKLRQTDSADTETLLRIIQSVPSPKAEPIKQWLAKVGAEKLEELAPIPLGTSIAQAWQEQPEPDADNLVWAEFLERMARLYRYQAQLDSRLRIVEATSHEHEEQLGELHSRMESNEALLRMVPELLERLGPERMTPEHQATVKALVGRLHEIGGYAYATIYADLNIAFRVGKYSDILESEWSRVEHWFTVRMEASRKKH